MENSIISNKNMLVGLNGEDLVVNDAISKHNSAIDDAAKRFEKAVKEINNSAKSINGLELVPFGNRILIQKYDKNPYVKVIESSNGLIIGGADALLKPMHKSNETGEQEEEKEFISVGQVIETGPDCKYVKEGDDVFYITGNTLPIRFFENTFGCLGETQILLIVNEGLRARMAEQE